MLPKHPLVATDTAVACSPLATTTTTVTPWLHRHHRCHLHRHCHRHHHRHHHLPPLFCDLFDCCVIVSSPLPHPVVAIPPTVSAIVIVVVVVLVAVVVVVVVVVVTYYPPLRVICLIVVCACPRPSSCRLPVAPPRPSTSRRLLKVDSIVNGVVVATRPLRWIIFGSRWTTGSNCCCHQPLPLVPGRRSEGRSVRQRPSIVSVAAMVAGGDDGLPWRLAGRQWLIESISSAHFDCYVTR